MLRLAERGAQDAPRLPLGQMIADEMASTLRLDEPRVSKARQMLRHRGLGDAQDFLESLDAKLTVAQQLDYPEASGMRERSQDVRGFGEPGAVRAAARVPGLPVACAHEVPLPRNGVSLDTFKRYYII
jgi:hypothetical protein